MITDIEQCKFNVALIRDYVRLTDTQDAMIKSKSQQIDIYSLSLDDAIGKQNEDQLLITKLNLKVKNKNRIILAVGLYSILTTTLLILK